MTEVSAVLLRAVPSGTDGSRFSANMRREEPGRCAGGARHVIDGARAHLDVILMTEAKHGTYGKRCVLPQPFHAEISRPALQPLLAVLRARRSRSNSSSG